MITSKLISTVDPSRRPGPFKREWVFPKYDHLQDAVKRFFEILDIKEESSFGREFHPNKMNLEDRKIDSCRVHNTAELASVLEQMKTLSEYK
jgi:hypothetical protein